jgi:hypothetical protein
LPWPAGRGACRKPEQTKNRITGNSGVLFNRLHAVAQARLNRRCRQANFYCQIY